MKVSDTTLSGLLARPEASRPRAVLVAIHGANMHAGYFDAQMAPGLSLMDLGSQHGYTVWAPDRPGIGASAGLDDGRIQLMAQADLLLDAIDEFAAQHPYGAGFVLVGHSYGLKVAWTMAAAARGAKLLGVDGSGSGVRYAFEWKRDADRPEKIAADMRRRMWGPADLYPEGTISRRSLPVHPMPDAQASEGGRWPDDIQRMAAQITVPLRLTFAEYEALWPTDPESLETIHRTFINARSLTIEIEPGAGHNLSLGWAARSYHRKVVAFAESLSGG